MLIKKPEDIKGSEITPRDYYLNRRQFIAAAATAAIASGAGVAAYDLLGAPQEARAGEKLPNLKKGPAAYNTSEKANSFKDITSDNNFYELGVDKGDPRKTQNT